MKRENERDVQPRFCWSFSFDFPIHEKVQQKRSPLKKLGVLVASLLNQSTRESPPPKETPSRFAMGASPEPGSFVDPDS